jgi:diguanylate cyclase (GGDEF)-like protein
MTYSKSRSLKGFVAVIDDDPEILDAIEMLLDVEGYQCATYPSATAYLDALESNAVPKNMPYCVLTDVMMPGLDGLALQQQMNTQGDFQIILMSGAAGARDVAQAFRSGAVDFLTKPFEDNELLRVIEKAHIAWQHWHDMFHRQDHLNGRLQTLTKRELEVARLVAQGDTNQMVADKLFIVLRTVKLHRQRAMEKLGCDNAVDLARFLDEVSTSAEVVSLRVEAKVWENAALRDPLTGVLNRRGLDHFGAQMFSRSSPNAVAVIDLDHFKKVNDTYGHSTGDQLLVVIAKLISKQLREGDLFVRLGGEEFGLVLPQTRTADALHICQRIRQETQDADWSSVHPELKVTISVGVFCQTNESSLQELIDGADKALYRAKREGRNRVVA